MHLDDNLYWPHNHLKMNVLTPHFSLSTASKPTILTSNSASYTLQQELGEGCFGKVSQAQCKNGGTSQKVAVKVLKVKANNDINREVSESLVPFIMFALCILPWLYFFKPFSIYNMKWLHFIVTL